MEYKILQDIVILFAFAVFVNFIFNRFSIPTIIGYMITGIVVGPYMLKLIHSPHEIEMMSEIGIVLLMFAIGMEFSLSHLFKIRRIVFFGGSIQIIFSVFFIFLISKFFNLSNTTSVFLGIITALSSSAIVLKILQDRSELTSNHGRTILGILIFQDILVLPILLFIPVFGKSDVNYLFEVFRIGIISLGIVLFLFVGYKWIIPKILQLVILSKNQELFLMVILLIGFSVALLTSRLGMSLAIGAFIAGLMISGSEYSHNAFGHLVPFKDTFTSFFFISIGMLLNLEFAIENFPLILSVVLVVIFLKFIVGWGTAFIFGHPLKYALIIGLSICQVGEFSFILANLGLEYKILDEYYFQVFLSVAVISLALTPLIIQYSSSIANLIGLLPLPRKFVEGLNPLRQLYIPEMNNHLVIIGKDSRSRNLTFMAKNSNIPYISVVYDPAEVKKRQLKREKVLYGDAKSEEVLKKAYIETAKVVVVSIGELMTAMAVVERVRLMNKHVKIIVRIKNVEDINELYNLGANDVIPEEFETAIDLYEQVMLNYLIPQTEIYQQIAVLRRNNYGIFNGDKSTLSKLSIANQIFSVSTIKLSVDSRCVGRSLVDLELRSTYGVTVVAFVRKDKIIIQPGPEHLFEPEDILYILGKQEEISKMSDIF